MPRRPRLNSAGQIVHVTARSNRGMVLFGGPAEYELFAALMAEACDDHVWKRLSWCLMPNHVHLLVRTESASLSAGMHWLLTTYARRFNDRRGRYGHVFQGRFASVPVTSERHLREAMRYIALNPVRAGLCAGPSDWPWSAHRALLASVSPSALDREAALAPFGGETSAGRETYREFVSDPGAPASPTDLTALVKELSPNALILCARDELGVSFTEIARALGWDRSRVGRRYRALTCGGPAAGVSTARKVPDPFRVG